MDHSLGDSFLQPDVGLSTAAFRGPNKVRRVRFRNFRDFPKSQAPSDWISKFWPSSEFVGPVFRDLNPNLNMVLGLWIFFEPWIVARDQCRGPFGVLSKRPGDWKKKSKIFDEKIWIWIFFYPKERFGKFFGTSASESPPWSWEIQRWTSHSIP